MTDKILIDRSVVEQALEALFMYKPMVTGVTFQHGLDAMQALRAALEQPQVEQEPVAVVTGFYGGFPTIRPLEPATVLPAGMALYANTHPPRQPLTDEQITELADAHMEAFAQFVGAGEVWFEGEKEFARAIERAHGITGEQE